MMTLDEFEDRMLAMCEGDWIDMPTGMAILESWFARDFSADEVEAALAHLQAEGLIERRPIQPASTDADRIPDSGMDQAEIRATALGEDYLANTGGGAAPVISRSN